MTISRFTNSNIGLLPGKILQVVRATDSTGRSTTSTSFTDASISVSITPQKSDSGIIVMWICKGDSVASGRSLLIQVTDSSNNSLSGAVDGQLYNSAGRVISMQTIIGYSTPGVTTSTTYKGRFKSLTGDSVTIQNDANAGQMYAIEVSA